MGHSLKPAFFSLFFLLTTSLAAQNWVKGYSLDPYIGPEIYYVDRLKEGGAAQKGALYGFRIGYDHVKRYKLYWGIDALWAKGMLTGHAAKERLKSEFTDSNAEARLGFTFASKSWRCASFTPYTGLGYFWESNNYQKPSPLTVHFKNTFSYVPGGFLSQIFLAPQWSLGLNFKLRYILEGDQKVTHDPKYGKLTQRYEEKFQYRVEVPMTRFFSWNCLSLAASLVPFYEYRCYGHCANFPFDFLETKLNLYGATLKIHALF